MISLEFKIDGVREVRKTMQATRRAALEWSPARRALRRALTQQARRWRIPVLSGRLRSSLTRAGHPDQVMNVKGSKIRFGTRTPYARVRLKRLPDARSEAVVGVLERHVAKTLKRRGLM